MPRYDFSVQKQLFEIAYQILEDYNISNWSFGGGTALSSNPYQLQDVFTFKNINVQTPIEILARKLKHRDTLTIRDFVDFAFVEQEDKVLTNLKSENIVDIDRFFDVVEQFNNFDTLAFNQELEHLDSYFYKKKEGLSKIINSLMLPDKMIKVALDEVEVVAFDHFIGAYRRFYEEIGTYNVFEIEREQLMKFLEKNFITYKDVLGLQMKDIEGLRA